MGVYNPHIPRILGQEWVPIREEDLFLSPVANTVEIGHGFSLLADKTLTTGAFYLNQFPSSDAVGQVFQVSVYRRGQEDLTGPIRSVVIPCNNGGVTGNASFSGASSVADALADPSDGRNVSISGGTPTDGNADLYFAVNSYSQLLFGKRILAVNLLYSATSSTLSSFTGLCTVLPSTATDGILYGATGDGTIVAPVAGPGRPIISKITFGEVSPFFSTTPSATVERLPWIYTNLQKFEASAANRITVRLSGVGNPSGTAIFFLYAALEVIFCEEQRVVVSGVAFGPPTANAFFGLRQRYVYGVNQMTMRAMSDLSVSPLLKAGDYSLMLSSPETGVDGVQNTPYPILNALRQLYSIPPHPGIQVQIPKPLVEGTTFTRTSTDILPQITISDSTSPLTDVHAYGRQAVAQVWGTVTATQEIYDAGIGTTAQYPQVRFYARRFGDTNVPLTLRYVAIPAITVSITPAAFDLLDEIVDGWKEVTLTYSSPPTLGGGTNPQFSFSAAGEAAGNRWEVLGAAAPALSGVPGNFLNLAPANAQLYSSTYGAPVSGAAVNLGWVSGISPLVSATTDDQASDGALIFSQNMPTVTGFTVQTTNQAVSGIGLNCGVNPEFIPSNIQYNSLSWPQLAGSLGYINDTFSRVVAAGWGSTDTGQPYTVSGTPADFSVNGSQGVVNLATTTRHIGVLDTSSPNMTVQFDVSLATLPASGSIDCLATLRYTDANNYYWGGININTSGSIFWVMNRNVAGVAGTFFFTSSGMVYTPGTFLTIKAMIYGSEILVKVWQSNTTEPDAWSFQTSDPNLTTGNFGGVLGAISGSPGGGAGLVLTYDNLNITTPLYVFDHFELQRMDTIDIEWKTIMEATSPLVSGFKDYEARVGILSSYRIRLVNVLDFAGPWSSTVTATIAEPGVTGTSINADTAVLIFTSNERQDGSINLAYSNAWEGSVNEDFTFPEASFVQLQPMYNKDFFTAFRPLERGGERFSRTVLVQAAAISPPTLADFTSLRDMAWDSVNYICVRDQEGNRWFATILVPSGKVQHFRRIYMAEVEVIQVTDTPTPVDPS